jgi:hypothetical protein
MEKSSSYHPFDSWDVENVQFIRSKSRANSSSALRRTYSTLSRSSRSMNCLNSLIEQEEKTKDKNKSPVWTFNSGSSDDNYNSSSSLISEEIETKVGINKDINNNNKGIHDEDSLRSSLSSSCRQLEDCYLIDVVTIRNESVSVNLPKVSVVGAKVLAGQSNNNNTIKKKQSLSLLPSKIPVPLKKAKSTINLTTAEPNKASLISNNKTTSKIGITKSIVAAAAAQKLQSTSSSSSGFVQNTTKTKLPSTALSSINTGTLTTNKMNNNKKNGMKPKLMGKSCNNIQ